MIQLSLRPSTFAFSRWNFATFPHSRPKHVTLEGMSLILGADHLIIYPPRDVARRFSSLGFKMKLRPCLSDTCIYFLFNSISGCL